MEVDLEERVDDGMVMDLDNEEILFAGRAVESGGEKEADEDEAADGLEP